MTRETIAAVAFLGGFLLTLLWSGRAGRGDSQEPQHVALQIRQDVGSLYASSAISNGLLAAILAALLVR
jgi:hypothetical protein